MILTGNCEELSECTFHPPLKYPLLHVDQYESCYLLASHKGIDTWQSFRENSVGDEETFSVRPSYPVKYINLQYLYATLH